MTTSHSSIPEAAVAAAARVSLELATPGFPWTDLVPEAQARFLAAARQILEAAATHMLMRGGESYQAEYRQNELGEWQGPK